MSQQFIVQTANEHAVIVAALRNPKIGSKLARTIRPEVFQVAPHQRLWEVLVDQAKRHVLYDRVQAITALGAGPDGHADCQLLVQLEEADLRLNADSMRDYVTRLRFDAVRFNLYENDLAELVDMVRQGNASPDAVAAVAERISRALRGSIGTGSATPRDVHKAFMARVDKRAGAKVGLGIECFDSKFKLGFYPGMSTLLGGVTGSGKTRVAFNMALALAHTCRPGIFAWEVSREEAIALLVCMETKIPFDSILFGDLTPEERQLVHETSAWLIERIAFFDFAEFHGRLSDWVRSRRRRGISIELVDTAMNLAIEAKVDVAFFDLFKKIMPEHAYEDTVLTLQHMQYEGKQLAMHSVLVHQGSTKQIVGGGADMGLGTFKGVSDWVDLPENAISVHRDKWTADGVEHDYIRLINDKQRWGPAGWAVRAKYDGPTGVMYDWEDVAEDAEEEVSMQQLAPKKSRRNRKGR